MLCFVLLLKFMSNAFDVNWLDKINSEKGKKTRNKEVFKSMFVFNLVHIYD